MERGEKANEMNEADVEKEADVEEETDVGRRWTRQRGLLL